MEIGAVVTMALFAMGVVFQTGRLTQRVDQLGRDVVKLQEGIEALRDEIHKSSFVRPFVRGT